jgi:hypothetical protein
MWFSEQFCICVGRIGTGMPPQVRPPTVTLRTLVKEAGTWPRSARAGELLKVRLRLNVAATVKLKLERGKQVRATRTVKVAAGLRSLALRLTRFGKPLAAGRYTLVVTATANGDTAKLTRTLRVTRAGARATSSAPGSGAGNRS